MDPRIPNYDWNQKSGSRLRLRSFFEPKNMVLWRNGFENGDPRISRDPNGLYGTQGRFLDRPVSPHPPIPTRKWFQQEFPQFGKILGWPSGASVYSLLAICGPRGLSNSRATPKGPVCYWYSVDVADTTVGHGPKSGAQIFILDGNRHPVLKVDPIWVHF